MKMRGKTILEVYIFLDYLNQIMFLEVSPSAFDVGSDNQGRHLISLGK